MDLANDTQITKLHGHVREYSGLIGLVVMLGFSFVVAFFGAQFDSGQWYQQLAKPLWTPPGWIFGPVWTLLYISMAVAAWLVWRQGGLSRNVIPMTFYGIQLALNALWSWMFFGMHQIGAALADITLLTLAVFVTTLIFFKRERFAGLLMVPYLLWVSFATLLNLQIWILN